MKINKQIGGNHYQKFSIEPIKVIVNTKLDFFLGNVFKYIIRDKEETDLEKAKHYLEMFIEFNLYSNFDYEFNTYYLDKWIELNKTNLIEKRIKLLLLFSFLLQTLNSINDNNYKLLIINKLIKELKND